MIYPPQRAVMRAPIRPAGAPARASGSVQQDTYAILEAAAIAAARANNAALWYIGRDLSGVFEDSAGTVPAAVGSPVGLWRDRQYGVGSSSGYHASQSTAANKPSVVGLGSGYWGAALDGTNDFLATATNPIGPNVAAYTMIAAAQHSSAAPAISQRQIICDGRGLGVADSSLRVLHAGAGRFGVDTPGTLSPGVALTASATYAGSGGTLILRRNGAIDISTAAAVPAPSTVISSGVLIGARTTSTEFWSGTIALACACAGVMPDEHRMAIERFASCLIGSEYQG